VEIRTIPTQQHEPITEMQTRQQLTNATNITSNANNTSKTVASVPIVDMPTTERLTELLRDYGMKATEENTAMLKMMLEKGIPLTKENVMRMYQAMKLTQSSDKALFMIQNQMRLTQANALQLDGLVNGQTKITDQIRNLLLAINQLEDTTLSAKLKQILNGSEQATHNSKPNEANLVAKSLIEQTEQQTTQPSTVTKTPISPDNIIPNTGKMIQTPQTGQEKALIQPKQNETAQASQLEQGKAPPQAEQVKITPQTVQGEVAQTAQTKQGEISQKVVPETEQGKALKAIQDETTQFTQVGQVKGTHTPQVQANSGQAQTTQSMQIAQGEVTQPPIQANNSNGLLYRIADSSPQDIDRFLNNLRSALVEIRQTMAGRSGADAMRVFQEARGLESHIEFTSQIRNQLFVQLPLYHNGQETLTSLHIYKDAKKSSGGGSASSAASALIALETASLGHFETYVQKTSRSVHCQFRLDNANVVKAVRANIHKLNKLLSDSNYTLDSFTFLPADKPYTLLDSPKIFESGETASLDDTIQHFNATV